MKHEWKAVQKPDFAVQRNNSPVFARVLWNFHAKAEGDINLICAADGRKFLIWQQDQLLYNVVSVIFREIVEKHWKEAFSSCFEIAFRVSYTNEEWQWWTTGQAWSTSPQMQHFAPFAASVICFCFCEHITSLKHLYFWVSESHHASHLRGRFISLLMQSLPR